LVMGYEASKPGFEQYFRETSVLEGEAISPPSVAERAAKRHRPMVGWCLGPTRSFHSSWHRGGQVGPT
jgi:hypothetical protein